MRYVVFLCFQRFLGADFWFFSLHNITANLHTEAGYKIIQEAELKILLPRSCGPSKTNYSLLPYLMPEMCVGREIRVAMITRNASTATLKYCNRTQTQSCALVSELHTVCQYSYRFYYWTQTKYVPCGEKQPGQAGRYISQKRNVVIFGQPQHQNHTCLGSKGTKMHI